MRINVAHSTIEGEHTWPGEGVGTAKSRLSSSTDGSPNLEITMACMVKFFLSLLPHEALCAAAGVVVVVCCRRSFFFYIAQAMIG
jgi:hypothetical protein